jgi:hypothetical protein
VNKDPLTRFLLAVRRRLWLEATLRRLRIALWTSGVTLLLLATIRLLWGTPSGSTALLLALAVGFATLLPTLLRRAPLQLCAIRADRHYGSRSLLTTAQEFAEAADSNPAASAVVSRARAAVPEWHGALDQLWHAPRPGAFVVAIVPAFLAALLLLLQATPGKDVAGTVDTAVFAEAPSMANADEDADLIVADLQRAISRQADSKPERIEERPAGKLDPQPVPGNSEPGAHGDVLADIGPAQAGPGFASTTASVNGNAGDARRRTSEAETLRDDANAAFSSREDWQIRRYGRATAGSAASDGDFVANTASAPLAESRIRPAPVSLSSSSWSALTTAEISYARTYLESAGKPNE